MSELFGFDAFSPKQIASRVSDIGVEKLRLPFLSTLLLSVIAGAFIGVGALYSMVVRADPHLGFAVKQLLSGLTFSLGLVLVVVAGAELFTGNNLLVMAWAGKRISTGALLRNWTIVLVGNAIGALGLACIVLLSGHLLQNEGALAVEYVRVAHAKGSLSFTAAFARAVLCNALVCMAVWMATAGRSVWDKVIAVVFPISAFVAAGFEHSVANFYLFPVAIAAQALYGIEGPTITLGMVASNLLPVLLGNVVGGSILVALIYFVIYERRTVLEPVEDQSPEALRWKIWRTDMWAVWSLTLGGLILVGLGLYFIFIRPPLLPEDLRYMGASLSAVQSRMPGLLSWLPHVFTVLGGHMAATGALACYVARTGFYARSPGAVLVISLAGALSIGLMAYINFAINSDFKWLILIFTAPWLLAIGLYAWGKGDASI